MKFVAENRIFCQKCDMSETVNYIEQGKSEGFDSCDRPSNLKLDSNFQQVWPWNLLNDLEKQ